MRANIPTELRHEFADPRAVVRLLNLERGAIRQGGRNVSIRCLWHEERSASCSVHVGRDRTIAVRCHACGATADALSLIAKAHDLDARRNFVEVCVVGAEIAGRWDLVDELRGNRERRPSPPPKPRPEPEPERDYPPFGEVRSLLTVPAWEDEPACAYLRGRGIDPERIEAASVGVAFSGVDVGALAYTLLAKLRHPSWATYKRDAWTKTGHRLILPMVDAAGELRSVRAIRIEDGDSPKRLPPGGHRAAGLVLADELALELLRGTWKPSPDVRVAVRIVEGEPDFLSVVGARTSIATATIGIVSGSWSGDFAGRIPRHALVAIQTHDDPAGDRYAEEISTSLRTAGVSVIERVRP